MQALPDFEQRRRRKRILRIVCVFCTVLLILTAAVLEAVLSFRSFLPAYSVPKREEGELRVHFLSVGQADCTIVEFPDGHVLFVDAGNGNWETNNRLFRYWKGLGKPKCELAVTHIATDHSGGAELILKRFGAETLYLPYYDGEREDELLAYAEKRKVPTEELKRYTVIGDETCYLACLSPRSYEDTDVNDASAVLYLRYAGVGILLAADISSARERLLLDEYEADPALLGTDGFPVPLDEVDVLKVAHHGSDSSSCEEFLRLVQAEHAVVSCGKGNMYGHPAAGAMERIADSGSEIYRTDELGDILLTVSPDGTYTIEYGYL